MKFESLDNSGETAMSIIFEPQEVPIISEIEELYLNKRYEEDPLAFVARYIIDEALEFSNNNEALSIDLSSEESPMFINKMSEVLTIYLSDQLAQWDAMTAKHPSWLLKEKVGITTSAVNISQDEMPNLRFSAHLDQLEAKLSDAKNITLKFQQMARALNE